MLGKNKLVSLLVCSTSLLGWINAQQQQQQEHHIVKYIRDSLQRRYSDEDYYDSSKKGKKWVQYEEDEDDDDYEDDYEDYEEGCEDDDQEEEFDWNPQRNRHYRLPPIPYITFIDPRATTTRQATTTETMADTTRTEQHIYSTTIDVDLGEGEIIGTTTDLFWNPYGVRDIGPLFDAPPPWESPPEYPPEPICYNNTASTDQIDLLNHFTGMFGSFILEAGGPLNIQGPVAAKSIHAVNANINTLTNDEGYCGQASEIARYGLVADELLFGGHLNGSVAFNSVVALQLDQTPQDCEFSAGVNNDIATKVLDLFPDVFYQTSASLASYQATYKFNADNSVSSLLSSDLIQQYMVFTFPPCSDLQCDATPTDADSLSNAILKGGSNWTGPPGSYFYEDKPTLLNIPVYVEQNYTITSEFVNAGGGILDPCHTVFHFYPVAQNGEIDTHPEATFNLIRGDNVVINGLILAPQANIYDAPTGGFGGQVITAKTFHSQGATIYDYASVGTCRQGRFACWPRTNDIIPDYAYLIVNASYHQDEVNITTITAGAETTTVVLSSQGIVDYTTVPTTSHSTATVTQTATVNGTSTEAVLRTEIAQVVHLVNVTENAIDYTTATTTVGRTRTIANQNEDPTTSTLVLVATALVESVVTRTSTITGVLLPPPSKTSTSASSETNSQTTGVVPETEHNADECTVAEHQHRHHHKHHKGNRNHKYDEDDEDDEDEEDQRD